MIRLGVLGSTKGSDLRAVLDAIHNDALDAAVVVVVSNRENSYILERARKNNIPDVFVPHKGKTRDEFDREITTALLKHNADLVLLVGFMRILGEEFCQKWQDRILNVHPSLLPKYAGGVDTNVHEKVLRNGDMETGCTIHFVTEEVDAGPILIQKKCAVTRADTVESLKTKVQQLEGVAFIEAIEMIANQY